MKKSAIRGAALLFLALAMVFAFMPLAAAAENSSAGGLSPIPLLVIKVSYDPNNNGVNDYDPENTKKLFEDKKSDCYGEQWCDSSDKYWADMLFADNGASLKAYYEEVSGGRFYFTPAEETYAPEGGDGKVNDGIVEVVVPYKHPMASTGSEKNEDALSRTAALKAAGEYVDFSKFDKNKDGELSYDELAIVFVCGGYEYSTSTKGRPTHKLAFGVWGHYTVGATVRMNGVKVGSSFVRVGEYAKANLLQTVGIFAHELGHFIGAPDLYDTNDEDESWDYAGNVTLMASGSHNKNSGRPNGTGPAYMDPYCAVSCGIQTSETVTKSGDYTLYSRSSEKGKYNILRINTPNPKEYYLIENRYHDTGDTEFDAISPTNMAIIIWHVDENITEKSFWRSPNSHGYGTDPGVVPMGISSLGAKLCGFRYIDDAADAESYTFESGSAKYYFPISGKSYTSLTDGQAKNFAVRITVKEGSYAGDEMTVNIDLDAKFAPEFIFTIGEKTTKSISFEGRVVDVFDGDVTGAKVIVSEDGNPTEENGIVKTIYPGDDGAFDATIDGLSANTKYFIKVIVTGKNGTREKIYSCYTAVERKPRDYYYVYVHKGLTAVDRSYSVKVKPGETLSYKFPMEKSGYDFCGWYTDSELTTRYDMGFTQTECKDFSLYAKWVETGKTATLRLSGAEPGYLLFACEVGDKFDAPVPAGREGYKFIGWYADAELTSPYDFGQTVDEAGEITIYAKWENENGEVVTTVSDKPAESTSATTVTTSDEAATTTGGQTSTGNVTVPTYVIVIVLAAVAVIAGVLSLIIAKKKAKTE